MTADNLKMEESAPGIFSKVFLNPGWEVGEGGGGWENILGL